jgi:hypothetical protein
MYYRRLSSFAYLILATFLGWLCGYLIEIGIKSIILFCLPPILFGLALSFSNKAYLKSNLNFIVIPLSFLFIYLYGTLPFSYLGELLIQNFLGYRLFGCISAFLLVATVVKITLNYTVFYLPNVLMSLFLPFACLFVESILRNVGLMELPISVVNSRLDLTILVYQIFLSINIVLMLKKEGKLS